MVSEPSTKVPLMSQRAVEEMGSGGKFIFICFIIVVPRKMLGKNRERESPLFHR